MIFARHDTFIDGRVLNGEGSVEVLRSTDARKGRFEADRADIFLGKEKNAFSRAAPGTRR